MTRTDSRTAILTVEDQTFQRETLRRVLMRRYTNLDHAASRSQALEVLAKGQHQVVLVDLRVPDLDGLGLVRGGLNVSPNSVFVLISEEDMGELEAVDAARGSWLHLRSPWDASELLDLVARAEQMSLAHDRQRKREAAEGNLGRLLLLEDDHTAAAMAQLHLNESGIADFVDHTSSLSAAVRRLSELPYDAIVADLRLPDSRGMETLRRLRDIAPDTPLIVWSGGDELDSGSEAFELGAQEWFSKDRNPKGLARAVSRAVTRTRRESELRRAATHDALTGFMKAEPFRARLSELCTREDTASIGLAVLYLDLDGFKPINDIHGHDAGDAILQHVGRELAEVLRRGDLGARMGGDEFALALTGVRTSADAEGVAKRILKLLTRPVTLPSGETASVSASAGVALASATPHAGAEAMLQAADQAMRIAKSAGSGRYQLSDSLTESVLDVAGGRQQLEEGRGLHLEFQPQVDLRTREVRTIEALLRLRTTGGNKLSGAEVVPQLQREGLAQRAGRWVLDAAARTLREQRERYPHLRVAVNLFPAQLWDPELPAIVTEVAEEHGLTPDAFDLEIDSAQLARSLEELPHLVSELRGQGIRVVLDDFGVGAASLDLVRVLPVDAIKLAPQLIAPLGEAARAAHFLEGLLRLADALGLEVIAEGVEKRSQLGVLSRLGCDACQGYLFGRPHFIGPSARLRSAA